VPDLNFRCSRNYRALNFARSAKTRFRSLSTLYLTVLQTSPALTRGALTTTHARAGGHLCEGHWFILGEWAWSCFFFPGFICGGNSMCVCTQNCTPQKLPIRARAHDGVYGSGAFVNSLSVKMYIMGAAYIFLRVSRGVQTHAHCLVLKLILSI